MNMLSSLQLAEVADGEWKIFHLMILQIIVFKGFITQMKHVQFCFSFSKWEVASTTSQSREQWKCKHFVFLC